MTPLSRSTVRRRRLLPTRFQTLTRWIESAADPSEMEQAIVRLVVLPLGIGFVATLMYSRNLPIRFFLIASACALVGSSVLFWYVASARRVSEFRKQCGIIYDIATITCGIAMGGAAGPAIAPWYLWISCANGVRFGDRYLSFAQALAGIGFAVGTVVQPWWHEHPLLLVGSFCQLIVVPYFVGLLIRQIRLARVAAPYRATARFGAAHQDPATGLPTAVVLEDRLKTALLRAHREEFPVSVAMVTIGATRGAGPDGEPAGREAITVELARELMRCARGSDTVACLGGGEVGFLVERSVEADFADSLSAVLQATVRGRLEAAGMDLAVGVATYPDDGDTVSLLMTQARLQAGRDRQ